MNDCEKYELAITNFVLGEKMNVSESELFNHLANCKNCQGDLRNWRATHAMLCAKEYDSRPEIKQKNEAFIKNLVYPVRKTGETSCNNKDKLDGGKKLSNGVYSTHSQPLSAKIEIISAAGKIYDFVKDYTNGDPTKKVAYPVIREKTGFRDYPFHEAMSHLVTNDKLMVDKGKDNRPAYAKLQLGA